MASQTKCEGPPIPFREQIRDPQWWFLLFCILIGGAWCLSILTWAVLNVLVALERAGAI